MTARALMIQGTSSSAGKSLLTAAFCRIFARRGMRVAPFKAQNMSNNAAVCDNGGEIGRSQAMQAAAAFQRPTTDMNPILLKPEAESRSQVIVNGRAWKTLSARRYFAEKATLWPVVTAALDRLRDEFELVVIEGAGSPAELNLRGVEIVNMSVARYCDASVLLVGDIERGGVFAQLLGTLWLLEENERRLVRGLLVNKFRGDLSLFDDGRRAIEDRGGVPVLGVVPWLADLDLPEEDAADLRCSSDSDRPRLIDIAVIRLPRIANFDDFAPLASEPNVRLRYVDRASQLGRPNVVVLPGTKSTTADLNWLRRTGIARLVVELAANGSHVVGVCGGYQMLGRQIRDPARAESDVTETSGLALLPIETVFHGDKVTRQIQGALLDGSVCPGGDGVRIEGYEIHMGRTTGGRPWLSLRSNDDETERFDGAVSENGRVWGCYVHGLFANDAFRRAWLAGIQPNIAESFRTEPVSSAERLSAALDRLADAVESAVDMQQIDNILELQGAAR